MRRGRPGSVPYAHAIEAFIIEQANSGPRMWSLVGPGYVRYDGDQGSFLG